MAFAYRNIPLSKNKPCDIFNLGAESVSRVIDIAEIVKEEMGVPGAKIAIERTKQAWPGDQPKVHISVERMYEYGWSTKLTSDQAVRVAVQRMLGTKQDIAFNV